MNRVSGLAASRDGLWVGAALVALAAAIITSAWVCDDAYITFRTVDNFTSGEGLRWNVAERVQSYTHPLWMFAISALYLVGGDVYYASLLLSFVCSMTAVAILAFRVAGSPRMALLGLAPLLFSRAFVDYSTSGLENPLTHLLLAIFFWRCAEPESGEGDDATRAMRLGLLAGLIGLNRLDALLLVTPAIAVFLATNRRWRARSVLGRIALGAAPLLAWELFSLFYYGFPFPNTAYAKLTTGVSEAALALQGLRYFSDSLSRDPLTLIATLAGVASAIWVGGAIATPQRNRRRAMAGGIALHLLYVVWIGGDFMSGRLFTSPLFCAALLICETRTVSRGSFAAAIAAVVALALIAGVPTLTSGPDYGSAASRASQESEHGIGDERAVYYPDTGLVRRWLGLARVEDHPWALDGKAARDFGLDWARGQALGLYGFYAGPQMHILDMVGLSDPLLARIDARRAWRIGHFEREIPRGYIATLRSGSNRIADPELAAYYDALTRVVRDPLFDAARLGVILRINLGALDAGLDGYRRDSSQ